ncbi:hypothetical protein P344_03570 [Spiroplasma mirum ATCC 29335]|uniref:Uncharacterized protein n=1 Tax=Spiroplasma mirum ATCC 29335 TaxID=838561 RepID=W0GR30_9MOLU|nr:MULTISPECIES: hypothetical protein [Spiroplasma]AHF61026.1 truncated C4-dicarboxylate transporter/malic acid transport protein [Spiroplasma mirum ATCC 29335]AHI58055.1 hypothetical protein P344_03570 [Spiroplasma mirum ATCC 29335]
MKCFLATTCTSVAAGAALGTATMGNAWGMFNQTTIAFSFACNWLKYLTISFAILIVGLILLRYIFTPKILVKELQDPTLNNFIPTIFMTCFVISGFCGDHGLRMLQLIIWLTGGYLPFNLYWVFCCLSNLSF